VSYTSGDDVHAHRPALAEEDGQGGLDAVPAPRRGLMRSGRVAEVPLACH
jgi:hypothetical protein